MNDLLRINSSHFSTHQLAYGIYAVIHHDGGAAICNAGLIDLGGLLLVFDTFLTPQAADDLYQFALETFNKAPQFVINSHYHNDHVWGNQVFVKEAHIISSTKTYQQLDTLGLEEFDWYTANAAKKLDEIQTRYQHAQSQELRESLIGMLGYYEGLVKALPCLKICKPNLTFNKHLHLYGEKRPAELITFSGGHTASDTVLYLPQDGIIFTGDLLFVNAHPYLSEGDPFLLTEVLNNLLSFNASIFIPGHGPIGRVEDIHAMISYIDDCLAISREIVESDSDLETISEIEIPTKYSGWMLPNMFQGNLKSICQIIKACP